MSGMEAALASGVLKVAGDKLVSLLATEFAAITGVKRDLSELQDIHAEITSWLSAARDRAIQSEPQSSWVVKLKDVAYDIDNILQEVQLEAEKQKMERDDDKSGIAGCFCAKPKTFAFRCKMARKIKAIKVRFAAIIKQRSDFNTLESNNFARDQHAGTGYGTFGEMSLLSKVAESKIPLRDKEKDTIISKLVDMSLERSSWQLLSTGRFSSHQLPSMHRLKHLALIEVKGLSSGWELLQHLNTLKELAILDCNDLTQLPESMRNLTSLEHLHIEHCPAIGTLPDWLGELHSLRRLVLNMGNDLKQVPEAIQHLTSLEYLNLFSGRALTELPEWIGQLSALRKLWIQGCPALQCLPQSIQRLTALEELFINRCPGLAGRYERGAGPDWHLVSHIPRVSIYY